MTVYIDIILLYNFLIDWLLLSSTAYILRLKPKIIRIVLGAGLGASYTIILFFPITSVLYTFLSKLILSICMILIVFGYHRLRVLFQRLLVFYLVAFILGGGLIGIHFYLQTDSEILSGIVFTQSGGIGSGITWGFIAVCLPLIWWLSSKGLKQIKERNQKAELYGEVFITIQEKVIHCKGLIDTGNQLYEPITRTPVMIMELEYLKEIIPSNLYQLIKDEEDLSHNSLLINLEDIWLQRIRIIPFRSVSRSLDLLLALRPDSVRILTNGAEYVTTRVLIGLNPNTLASDGSYQAIIHPVLINEKYVKEPLDQMSKKAI